MVVHLPQLLVVQSELSQLQAQMHLLLLTALLLQSYIAGSVMTLLLSAPEREPQVHAHAGLDRICGELSR